MTERGQYRFNVKKNARGEFWIAAEPAGHTIESLDDCVLGLRDRAAGHARPCGGRRRFSEQQHYGHHADLSVCETRGQLGVRGVGATRLRWPRHAT